MSQTGRIMLIAIGVALIVAVLFTMEHGSPPEPVSASGAGLALAALGLLMAGWFLHAFVLAPLPSDGDGREQALTDIYAFAYVYSLTLLALMAFPFGNLLSERSWPESGPIRLVRGCVVAPAASAATSVARAASDAPLRTDFPKGMPLCDVLEDTHTVLISVGGVIAAASAPAAAPASAGSAAMGAPASYIYRVRDGFVVPLMMAVLAVIGGVINLMRRIPEYQKRTHADFTGTDKDKPLAPYEAREFVVFQVLQLTTAPFLAMVALHIVAPQSLAGSVALAFASGFFAEGVLLRIRAVLEGPEKTPTEATSKTTGELLVTVTDTASGKPLEKAEVTLLPAGSSTPVKLATDKNGLARFRGVAIGAAKVGAVAPPAPGAAAPAVPAAPAQMETASIVAGAPASLTLKV